MSGIAEVVVVGGGICGLACAQALSAAGRPALVLERARGVGGRCATRRLGGQPVDLGVAFLHGRDPELLAALRAVPATRLEGWPASIQGTGRPCQPEAFAAGSWRLAYAEGLTAFPKALAQGLTVRLETRVVGLSPAGEALALRLEDGGRLEAGAVVLALAPEQALELLATLEAPPPEVRSARAVLDMAHSQPCLTVLATYPDTAPRPGWHVSYPEDSRLIQIATHDSAKRAGSPALALVIQAHPAWSRQHLEDPAWPEALLAEAGARYGAWAARPAAFEKHRWRYARTDDSAELAGPLLLRLPGGVRLGLAGDRFAPGGGVESAWRSGRRLARRLLEEA
jgi:predicted NAD/FAD-dependent oxidoreductase